MGIYGCVANIRVYFDWMRSLTCWSISWIWRIYFSRPNMSSPALDFLCVTLILTVPMESAAPSVAFSLISWRHASRNSYSVWEWVIVLNIKEKFEVLDCLRWIFRVYASLPQSDFLFNWHTYNLTFVLVTFIFFLNVNFHNFKNCEIVKKRISIE